MPSEWLAVCRAIKAHTPALPDAACRNDPRLFDVGGRHADYTCALALCCACPSLGPCKRWLDSLPAWQRPEGIVAGQLVPSAPPAASCLTRFGKLTLELSTDHQPSAAALSCHVAPEIK